MAKKENAIRPELDNFNDVEKGWNEALKAAAGSIRKQVFVRALSPARSRGEEMNSYYQAADGCYYPLIPEPFWVRHYLFWARPGCYQCRAKFRNRAEWEEHYIKYHSADYEW